ncbi:MAG: hypothetical protein IK032_04225 [Bacteroidales bacterium]|nr:hypothetical protein [Bacteroidales bacterium]
MSLNKKYLIVITICLCTLMCTCSTDYYNAKWFRKNVRKHAAAVELARDQLPCDLQNLDYEMDSCERLRHLITDSFTVVNIYKGKDVYEIVLFSSDSSYYEVYSPKAKNPRGEKIKEGKTYKMTIVPYFDFKGKKRRPIEIVRLVYIKGYLINPYPLFLGQVYYTDNLEWLFFIADEL